MCIPLYSTLADAYDPAFSAQALAEWRIGICRLLDAAGVRRGTVLDIGCGTGVGALALSEFGEFTCDGVDASMQMLSRCAGDRYRQIRHGRFPDDVPGSATYDLACCGFDTFNYLPPANRLGFLERVHAILIPGGLFALDVITKALPQSQESTMSSRVTGLPSVGLRLEQTSTFEQDKCTTVFEYREQAGHPSGREVHVQHYCDMEVLEKVMSSVELKLVDSCVVEHGSGLPMEKIASLWRSD